MLQANFARSETPARTRAAKSPRHGWGIVDVVLALVLPFGIWFLGVSSDELFRRAIHRRAGGLGVEE